jgi:hypothetical protein
MKKIFALFLSVGLSFACSTARASGTYSPYSLSLCATGHGAFTNNDTIPLSAGVGACVFGDWRPIEFLSFGTGFSYSNFPGDNSWQVFSWDLGGRLFPFGSGGAGEWYLQGGIGYNLVSHNLAKNGSYPGNYHATVGLGYRVMLGPGMALDLGPKYDFYTPLLHLPNINSFGVKAGITWLLGKNQPMFVASATTQTASAPTSQNEARVLGVPITKQELSAASQEPVIVTPAMTVQASVQTPVVQASVATTAAKVEASVKQTAVKTEIATPALRGPKGRSNGPVAKTEAVASTAKAEEETVSGEMASTLSFKGHSLWDTAARADIYGDPELYPLLVDANKAVLKPKQFVLAPDTKLVFPKNPTQEMIAKARKDAWTAKYQQFSGRRLTPEAYQKWREAHPYPAVSKE